MLQFLSQQTILFYTMALICAWGVISQVVLRLMYGNLLRDVRRQGMAKGKFMKQLRQRLYAKICWSTVFLEDLCIPGNGWHRWLPYYVQHWERSDGISASRRRLAA